MNTKQEQVLETVIEYFQIAAKRFGKTFKQVEVLFDLGGSNGGQVEYKRRHWIIRFNPRYMISHMPEFLSYTVPHEVAHVVAVEVFGRIKPHGPEWRHVMRTVFEVDAHVTHDYTYPYLCDCRIYDIDEWQHQKIQSGKKIYACKHCDSEISPVLSDVIAN